MDERSPLGIGAWAGVALALAVPLVTIAVAWGSIQATLLNLSETTIAQQMQLNEFTERFHQNRAAISEIIVELRDVHETADRNLQRIEEIRRDLFIIKGLFEQERKHQPDPQEGIQHRGQQR
jgi:DNA repair ATPase RecN